MNPLLEPLGRAYGTLMAARNAAFDSGWFNAERVDVPVIAVGNLSVGGTGKTPLVEFLLGMLIDQGRRPAMVSRGYGRTSGGVVIVSRKGKLVSRFPDSGDEALQIAKKFPGASVVVGERRVRASRVAISACNADIIVLDDAFQHRAIHRDLNILVLDALQDLRRERVLPAGRLRERLGGIHRADLIGFSGGGAGGIPPWASGLVDDARVFSFRQRISDIVGAGDDIRRLPVFTFSGIGNPGRFLEALDAAGVRPVGEKRFSDHHRYSGVDLDRIAKDAAAAGASVVLTTEKDAMRIDETDLADRIRRRGLKFAFTRSTVEVLSGEERLREAVRETSATLRRYHDHRLTEGSENHR